MHQANRRITAKRRALWTAHDFHALQVVSRYRHHERLGQRDTVVNHLHGGLEAGVTEGTAEYTAH